MKEITIKQLNEILTKHAEWVNSCGVKGARADLRGANLSGADLSGADLSGADLRHANLSGANLWYADLWRSNLWCANLSYANLLGASLNDVNLWYVNFRHANLESANLKGTDLSDANLSGANLRYANLRGTNLWSANISNANLRYADLRCANLSDANLSGADLWYTDLWNSNFNGAKIDFPIACPEKGSFIAFKKVKDDYIVELLIPEDARRCSATSEKCRCDKAKVLSITKLDGTSDGVDTVYSKHDETFAYKIGEIVEVKDFDDNRWNECSTGIHFFVTRQEAVEY